MIGKVDILKALDKERLKKIPDITDLLLEVDDILETEARTEREIRDSFNSTTGVNTFNLDAIDVNRIYHIESIKTICIDYRLRFLDVDRFKNQIPAGAVSEIKRLAKEEGISVNRFKILAPSKMFELENLDCDPLLMAPMGSGRYYLIHQWGSDMASYKKIINWPLRSFPNLFYSALTLSLLITLLLPTSWLTADQGAGYWDPARFAFIPWSIVMVGSVLVFYWFALHSKFSEDQWDSQYLN